MLDTVTKFGTDVLAIAAILGAVWAIWRFSLVQAQAAAIKAYQDVIDGLEKRVAQLEGDQAKRDEQIAAQEREIGTLRGRLDGKDDTIASLYTAALESGGCLNAFTCPTRVIPGA